MYNLLCCGGFLILPCSPSRCCSELHRPECDIYWLSSLVKYLYIFCDWECVCMCVCLVAGSICVMIRLSLCLLHHHTWPATPRRASCVSPRSLMKERSAALLQTERSPTSARLIHIITLNISSNTPFLPQQIESVCVNIKRVSNRVTF